MKSCTCLGGLTHRQGEQLCVIHLHKRAVPCTGSRSCTIPSIGKQEPCHGRVVGLMQQIKRSCRDAQPALLAGSWPVPEAPHRPSPPFAPPGCLQSLHCLSKRASGTDPPNHSFTASSIRQVLILQASHPQTSAMQALRCHRIHAMLSGASR